METAAPGGGSRCSGPARPACSVGQGHEQSEAVAGPGPEREGADDGGAPRHREVRDGVVREVARAPVPVRGGAACEARRGLERRRARGAVYERRVQVSIATYERVLLDSDFVLDPEDKASVAGAVQAFMGEERSRATTARVKRIANHLPVQGP